MKNSILQNATIMTFIISFFFVTNHLNATDNSHETNDNYLTVRESLIPMIVRRMNSGTYTDEQFPLERINPGIREYIHFYLEEDNSNSAFISDSIWLLGFIGNKDDILFIQQYIDKIIESSTKPDNSIKVSADLAGNVGCFAGMMFKRNIEGAESFLKKYANVNSWMIPSVEDTLENLYTARKFYSYFLMCSYQYSKSPYISKLLQEKSPDSKPYRHESVADSYLAKKEDRYTELMKSSTLSREKIDENIANSLKLCDGWIDMLMNKKTLAEWLKEHEEEKTVSNTSIISGDSFAIVDMNETLEGAKIKAIAVDSVKAYFKMPTEGNAENILIKKEFLQDLQKAGLNNFDNFHITAEVHATIDNFVPSINISERNNERTALKPTIVRDKVNANVAFDIKGTSDMLKKYGPDAVHVSLLSPKTGNFVVNMIRINENWMWAPVVNSPVSTDSNIVDDKYLVNSVNKALIAYSEITKSIIDGNYDYLTIPVLNNEQIIPLEKRKKDKDEMTNALDIEKKVLEDLKKNNLNNYSDYHLKIIFDATLDNGILNLDTGSMLKDIKGYETADLTFIIRNGGKAFMAHTTSRNDRSCIDSAGNLKVNMKRINGVWYWNPFGW